jgi:chromosome segregation ATPase
VDTLTFIGIILGSNTITAILVALFDRRRKWAETEKILSDTKQSETIYYQNRVEETIKQMRAMEKHIEQLRNTIELAQTKYEQRVGSLHLKIDGLQAALDRANEALDKANDTISQLRQEVKDGNSIITELRKEITSLLISSAATDHREDTIGRKK